MFSTGTLSIFRLTSLWRSMAFLALLTSSAKSLWFKSSRISSNLSNISVLCQRKSSRVCKEKKRLNSFSLCRKKPHTSKMNLFCNSSPIYLFLQYLQIDTALYAINERRKENCNLCVARGQKMEIFCSLQTRIFFSSNCEEAVKRNPKKEIESFNRSLYVYRVRLRNCYFSYFSALNPIFTNLFFVLL